MCVYSGHVLRTKLDYIHANPVKRGLVQKPEDWMHSSFGQLEMGRDGVYTCDTWPEGVEVSLSARECVRRLRQRGWW